MSPAIAMQDTSAPGLNVQNVPQDFFRFQVFYLKFELQQIGTFGWQRVVSTFNISDCRTIELYCMLILRP